MRKFMTLLLAAAFLGGSAQAQQDKEKVKVKTGDPKPWTVKWNPGSLVFGKISLHSEYNYKKKKSITFGVGIPVETKLSRNTSEESVDLRLKTFSIQGGYRMYLGKKTMTGFYFEPYLKYLNFKGAGMYDDKDPVDRNIYAVSVNNSSFGLGAQLGVQFMIARVVTFDAFILGPEANIAKFDGTFQDITSPIPWTLIEEQDARREVQDVFKDIPVIGKTLADNTEVDKNNRTVKTKYSGFLPGFRFGISVGVHF